MVIRPVVSQQHVIRAELKERQAQDAVVDEAPVQTSNGLVADLANTAGCARDPVARKWIAGRSKCDTLSPSLPWHFCPNWSQPTATVLA
jgi:hypothetical protein